MLAWFKSKIQKHLRRHGMRITHDRDDMWPPDCDLLGMIVESMFAPMGPKTIVQIGANDGVSHDPVDHLIRRYSMKALRVEPLPELFSKLKELHASDSNIEVVNAALDESDGQRRIWRVIARGDANRFSSISSFDRRVVEKHFLRFRSQGGELIEEIVQAISPETLVRRYLPNQQSIDILQVDTEGHDGVIVRAFLKAGITPKMINYEHNHLKGEDDRSCIKMMRSHGYELVRYGRDTLGLLRAYPKTPARLSLI